MVGVLNEYVRIAGYVRAARGSTPDLVWLSDWRAHTPADGSATSAAGAPTGNWLR